MYLRLREADAQIDDKIHVTQSVDISSQLYGCDIMSAYKLAHGFTKTFLCQLKLNPDEIVEAQSTIEAKRKVTRIICDKSPPTIMAEVGDIIDVYVKKRNEKRGTWSSPRTVLSINNQSGAVAVPGAAGHFMKAVFEYIWSSIDVATFSQLVREANDTLNRSISELVDILCNTQIPTMEIYPLNDFAFLNRDVKDAISSNPDQSTFPAQSFYACFASDEPTGSISSTLTSTDITAFDGIVAPEVSDQVEVFWPLDDTYYLGVIAEEQNGNHTFVYDAGAIGTLDCSNQKWRFQNNSNLQSISATTLLLESDMPAVLSALLVYFGYKPFLRYQAAGFSRFSLKASYTVREADFKKTVKLVPLAEVPENANIISIHAVYKIKTNAGQSLKLKAQIAPH